MAFLDLNGDGRLDLYLVFDKRAMVANGDLSLSTTQLVLTGNFAVGIRLRGTDGVTVTP